MYEEYLFLTLDLFPMSFDISDDRIPSLEYLYFLVVSHDLEYAKHFDEIIRMKPRELDLFL